MFNNHLFQSLSLLVSDVSTFTRSPRNDKAAFDSESPNNLQQLVSTILDTFT